MHLSTLFFFLLSLNACLGAGCKSARADEKKNEASSGALSDEIDVVLDLEHSIVQPIPKANTEELKNTEVIQVGTRYFTIADDAKLAIDRLLRDPRVKLSVVGNSRVPEAETRALLNAIVLNKSDPKQTLSDFVSQVVPYGPVDALLDHTCKNLKQCVFVTDSNTPALKDKSGNSGQILDTGDSLYQFPSFAKSQEAAEEMKKKDPKKFDAVKDSFPSSEANWALHEKRADGFYQIINTALAAKNTSFEDSLKEGINGSYAAAEEKGKLSLQSVTRWLTLKGKVTGCEEKLPDGTINSLKLTVCQKELPTHLTWTGPSKKECSYVTENGATLSIPVDTCLKRLKTYYLWTEKQLDRCGVFNDLGVLVDQAPTEKCTVDVICDTHTGVLSAFTKNLANELTFKILKNFSEISDAKSSLNRASSFASILMNPQKNQAMSAKIGAACSNFLKAIYASGKDLSSRAIVKAARPLSEEHFLSGKSHNNFYHHTTSDIFPNSLHPEIRDREAAEQVINSEGAFDKTFFFLRQRTDRLDVGLWLDALYMAEDPVSSASYGPKIVEISFDPEKTKIVDQAGAFWGDAMNELEAKYPGLKTACEGNYYTNSLASTRPVSLSFVIADDSGIDMIDYTWGGGQPAHSWFQVLSLKNAQSTAVH